MRNIYPNLMVKMLSGNEKNLYNIIFPDFGCMHSRMCVRTLHMFLVGEIADRFLGRALYG